MEIRYRNRSSILTIEEICKERFTSPFSFSEACKEEILNYILNVDTSKTCQDTDVPTRAIKENADIFADFLRLRKL